MSTYSTLIKAKEYEIVQLMTDNVELRTSLEKALVNSSSDSDITDLKDRVAGQPVFYDECTLRVADFSEELEASLTNKVQELDESDDRVRDMYKNNAKLEKKIAKLSRQIATAETAANTAANRSISAPLASMAPPPIPLPKTVPIPAAPIAAPSPRQPLRPVNIFEPSQQTPSIGSKRGREADGDEKPLPADCILLPQSNEKAKIAVSRTAFTPQRGAAHGFGSRENIFANPDQTKSATRPSARNSFAFRNTSSNVFQLP